MKLLLLAAWMLHHITWEKWSIVETINLEFFNWNKREIIDWLHGCVSTQFGHMVRQHWKFNCFLTMQRTKHDMMSMLKNTSRKSLCVLHDFPSCKRQLMSLALGCFKTLTNLKMSQWDCSEFDVMCHWRGMHLRLTCSLDDWKPWLKFMLSLDMCCCMDDFFAWKHSHVWCIKFELFFNGLFVWHLQLSFSLCGFNGVVMKAILVFELVCCQSGLAAAQCSTVGKLLWVVWPAADSARGNSLQRSICPWSAPTVLCALQI